jgi:diguanylate cyclase (GGDEF)-like protein/PAS domain S-box-containing protein
LKTPHTTASMTIRAEQVRLLFGSPGVTLLNLFNAIMAAALLWRVFPIAATAAWLAAMSLTILARGMLWRRYQRLRPPPSEAGRWGRAFLIGTAATGVLWGLLGLVPVFTNDPFDLVFVAFLLGGMTAGSSMRDAIWPPAFYVFAGPVVAPLVIVLLLKGDRPSLIMAFLLASFGVVLGVMGYRNSRWLGENVRLRLEQAELNENLSKAGDDLRRQADEGERTAAQLKDSNERLRGIAESAQDAMVILNGKGAITYWNPAAERIFGYVAGEVLGQDFRRLLAAKETREQFANIVRSSRTGLNELQGRVLTVESVRKDGSRFPVDVSVSPMQIAGAWHVLAIGRDVSERRRAEEDIAALHQSMADTVEALQRHERDMAAIARMSDMLQACQSRAEAFPIIAATAGKLFKGASGGLSLSGEGDVGLQTVTQWGGTQILPPGFSFSDCWALRTGQRYEVAETNDATLCSHFTAPIHGPYVCLPLSVQGETAGLLHLSLPSGSEIDEDLRRLVQSFGDVVKLSLSNLKLREILSEQAMRDPLTTLFNRHYLNETLPREMRRAERERTKLSIAILDIDHFKALNDSFGHGAGDMVLKEIGTFLRGFVRGGDVACRYGGEEFLLALPECDLEAAVLRLREACGELSARVFLYHGETLPSVTLSAGVAEMSKALSTPESLIAAADQALYEAKRKGRDRIEVFDGRPKAASTRSATPGGPKHPARRLQAS